ncbi:hypothetical protein HAX54_050925, partial [Datura stramonium]|nr:hypothetical protein [Datura stramonium]
GLIWDHWWLQLSCYVQGVGSGRDTLLLWIALDELGVENYVGCHRVVSDKLGVGSSAHCKCQIWHILVVHPDDVVVGE